MGLSIAIAGGIMAFALMYVITSFGIVSDNSMKVSYASSSRLNIDDSSSKTNINVVSIDGASSNIVNFTITNNGNTKLWNYDKFTVIVTYDANISGSKITKTDQLTYEKTCTSTQRKWCNLQFINDLQDPGILNSGESLQIKSKLLNSVYSTNKLVRVVIATDNGVISSKSVILP